MDGKRVAFWAGLIAATFTGGYLVVVAIILSKDFGLALCVGAFGALVPIFMTYANRIRTESEGKPHLVDPRSEEHSHQIRHLGPATHRGHGRHATHRVR